MFFVSRELLLLMLVYFLDDSDVMTGETFEADAKCTLVRFVLSDEEDEVALVQAQQSFSGTRQMPASVLSEVRCSLYFASFTSRSALQMTQQQVGTSYVNLPTPPIVAQLRELLFQFDILSYTLQRAKRISGSFAMRQ